MSKAAKSKLAEEIYYGEVPSRKIQRKWNYMVTYLNKMNTSKFMKYSREVQALVPVFVDDDMTRGKITQSIKTARYVFLKNGSPDMAMKSLARAKKLLGEESVHITPLM